MTLEIYSHNARRGSPGRRFAGAVRYLVLSLAVLAMAGCSPEHPFRLGTNQWIGYEGFYLARSLGHYERTRIKLVELPSATEVQQALRDGLLEAGALTLDETLTLLADGVELVVVLVMDISHGGDALLAAPSLDALADLAGRRIGVETSAVGALLVDGALAKAGLSSRDVTLIPMTADRHVPALTGGQVEAVVTFEPGRTQLVKAGYRVLFDSRELPGQIIDVLAVRSGALPESRTALRALLAGYFKALDYLSDQPQDAHRRMARRLEVEHADVPIMLAGIHLPEKAENHHLLSGTSAPLRRSAVRLARIMERAELLATGSRVSLTTTAEFLPPP